jgi:hypothetical protein
LIHKYVIVCADKTRRRVDNKTQNSNKKYLRGEKKTEGRIEDE